MRGIIMLGVNQAIVPLYNKKTIESPQYSIINLNKTIRQITKKISQYQSQEAPLYNPFKVFIFYNINNNINYFIHNLYYRLFYNKICHSSKAIKFFTSHKTLPLDIAFLMVLE